MNRLVDSLRTTCAVAAIATSIGLLGACGGDSAVASVRPAVATTAGATPTDAPAPTPTEAPAPTPTEAPAPTPTAAPGTDETDGDSDNVLIIVLIIAGAALAVVAIVAGLSGSRSRSTTTTRSAQSGARAAPLPPSPQSSLLSTSQWINDQLSLELMAAAPDAAVQRWSIERSRLDNVAIGAQQEYLRTGAASWQLLGQSMSSLASAIDTNLRLRAQDPPNADLITESLTVVNRQRAELRQVIAALAPTIER